MNNTRLNNIMLPLFWAVVMLPIFGENAISPVLRNDMVSRSLSAVSCVAIVGAAMLTGKLRFNIFHMIVSFWILERCFITLCGILFGVRITGTTNLNILPFGLIAYLSFFLLVDSYMDYPQKLKNLFSGLTILTTTLVILNLFITSDLRFLGFSDIASVMDLALRTHYGESRWLFGHRNVIYTQHVMWILFSYINRKLHHKSYTGLFIVQSVYTIFISILSWNSTMMFCSIIMLLLVVTNIFSKIGIFTYISVYFALEIGIVFLRLQNIFAFIVVDMMHRSLTFSQRTFIWDDYIEQYLNGNIINWLVGNFGFPANMANAHNAFLDFLAYNGSIGIALWCFCLLLSACNLHYERNSSGSKFIALILFIFLINSLTMAFVVQPLLVIFVGYEIIKINHKYLGGWGGSVVVC